MERKTEVRKDGKKEVEDEIEPPNVDTLIKRKRGDIMKGKIKRKYPAVWKIRHRSGNIRDHPQRYHINVGKRYLGVDSNRNVKSKEVKEIGFYRRGYEKIGFWKRKRRSWRDELDGFYDTSYTRAWNRNILHGGDIAKIGDNIVVSDCGYATKSSFDGRGYVVHTLYVLNDKGIAYAKKKGFIKNI
ncbi:MAG TPA: hypothetical protein ENG41_02580 [Methanomicrobia archaeon]|nr:hypothetical protein [Methanomicrobia archaeon]